MAHLSLSVVTIRDSKTHSLKDVRAILAGKAPLMTDDKVFLDVNLTDDQGDDLPDAAPGDILYECYYGGRLSLAFSGAQAVEGASPHWSLGGQGIRKLEASKGNAVVLRLTGGSPGTSNARVSVRIGDQTAEVFFPYCD